VQFHQLVVRIEYRAAAADTGRPRSRGLPHPVAGNASLSVYPDAILPFVPTPFTVLPSAPGSYVWDATLTAGKYAFSVYGPDGFLTSFAGQVVPAAQNSGQVPVVTAILQSGTVELTLANEGQQEVTYTLTPNDFKGHTPRQLP
jgi:phospholipase C